MRTATRIRPRLGLLAILALATTLAAACTPAAQEPGAAGSSAAVKIIVDSDGAYEVPAGALRKAGFDLTGADPGQLVLETGGRSSPFLLAGRGRTRSLRFYGQGLAPSSYDGRNVYWLSTQASSRFAELASLSIPERQVAPPPGLTPTGVVSTTVRVEEQRQYQSQVSAGDDHWFWQPLFAPSETDLQVVTPHVAPGEGDLRLRVWGSSSASVNPDHHLLLTLNGTPIADRSWEGLGAHIVTATVPSGILQEGRNRLTLKAPGDTGAQADALLIDWVDISYPQELILDGAALAFTGRAPGFTVRIPAKTASRSLILWDVTDPAQPTAVTGYEVAGNRLSFASDNTVRRFLLTTPAGLKEPREIVAAASPDLHDWPGGADMIIVTVPQFRQALEPLVEARRAAGLRVAVVDLQAVYDTFNDGRAGPEAIRSLVQYALAHWRPPRPRFLLLAGDASYDPRGHLSGSEADLVPTQLVDTAYTGWTASDVWYALPDEETEPADSSHLEPLLAVGRFPAQTSEQMETMVDKTLTYERDQLGAPWTRKALLLADNDDPGFKALAQKFGNAVGSTMAPEILPLTGDGSQTREELLRALHEGVGLLGYFGHGSMTLWAREKIFRVEDVAGLDNRSRLPIVFTVTCLSGLFNHPTTVSLGETLLRAGNGGAVAALVPSSAGSLPEQRYLSEGLAESLADLHSQGAASGFTLGEAIQRAQAGVPNGSTGARQMGLTFNLLGDPALLIER
jgi:hypothetical protein